MANLHKLSALKISKLRSGTHGDGGGLWLQVRPTGSKNWLFRFMIDGKTGTTGLGSYDTVSLAQARREAQTCRELLAAGKNPLEHRRAERTAARAPKPQVMTFALATAEYLAAHKSEWGIRHGGEWRNTIRDYVAPTLGKRDVATITKADVARVLKPIWTQKPAVATRLRARIAAVLDWCKAMDHRTGDNPADWRGALEALLPKPNVRPKHHAAMPYISVPVFWRRLADVPGMPALTVRFLILTAGRSGEIRGATWSEIRDEVWEIPAARMKARKEHRVPLTPAMLALLPTRGAPDQSIFGVKSDKTLGDVLRRYGAAEFTIHGFRSTFRDWAAEQTSFPRELAEVALAHSIGDATERAYQRGDLLLRRRTLMQDWCNYVVGTLMSS
jgi:integrase